jgi:hypothetical protein
MSSAVVGQFTSALPGSANVQGSAINAYSGFAIDDDLTLWVLGAGGHTDSSDNRIVKYVAGVDSPTGWVVTSAASTPTPADAAYFADGKPNSTHTYDYTVYHAATRKVYRVGAYGLWVTGGGSNNIDGVSIDTGTWDAAGTHPYTFGTSLSLAGAGNSGVILDESSGNIFWGGKKWVVGSTPTDTGSTIGTQRFPGAFDTSRTAFFFLQYGDGWGDYTGGLRATQTLNPSTSPVKRAITFNSSAALTQFNADRPIYADMKYDSLRDKFLFVYGGDANGYSGPPKYIEITPNSGTTWDMAVYTPSGTLGNIGNSGIIGKWKYIRRGAIGGFLGMSQASNGLRFLRTS